jgi:hypothetical protein
MLWVMLCDRAETCWIVFACEGVSELEDLKMPVAAFRSDVLRYLAYEAFAEKDLSVVGRVNVCGTPWREWVAEARGLSRHGRYGKPRSSES